MNRLVLAAFLVVAAVADAAPGPPSSTPQYHYLLKKYRDAFLKVYKIMPYSKANVEEPGFHFGLFVGTVIDLVETLGARNNKKTYDDYYYEGVFRGVLAGVAHHDDVVDKFFKLDSVLSKQMWPVMQLVDKKNSTDSEVQAAVDANPALQISANIIVAAGEFSDIYLRHDFVKEATEHTVLKALVEGKEKLKPLISYAVSVFPYTNDFN